MKTITINDGGPAFPSQYYDFQPTTGEQVVREHYFGATMRDYFAAEYQVWNEHDGNMLGYSDRSLAEALGIEYPDWSKFEGSGPERNAKAIQIRMQIEARLRYMHADAMIAARFKPSAQ